MEESEKIQKLLAVHHTYVDILKSLGVDPIKHYQENQVEALLERVSAGDKKCCICKKSYYSTQKLKNHLRKRHLGKTPYQCEDCKRYYGDSLSLKVHRRKHSKPGEESVELTCKECKKSFPSVGKLNQHMEKHEDIKCPHCQKGFAYRRTMLAHSEESCPRRPGAQDKSTDQPSKSGDTSAAASDDPRWHCHLCSHQFGATRNFKKYLNSKHGGAKIPIRMKLS